MDDQLLRRIPFLSDLPTEEYQTLAKNLSIRELAAGEILFRKGDVGDAMFLIVNGEVEILRGEGTPDEKIIAERRGGDYIGEMSLLIPGGRRTSSVRARFDSCLLELNRQEFEALLKRQPNLIFNIARILSERLDASNTSSFQEIVAKNRELQQAYDELKAAQEQIIAKEKLEKELQLAATIQQSILPKTMPALANFDFGVHMTPARAVGGDFYDLFQIGEHRTGILIGDVADKGVPSAIFMARVHALISAEAFHCDHPGEVLRRVNTYLLTREEIDLFITVIYGVLDNRIGTFTYARAGHEIPILHQPGQPPAPIPNGRGQPLGILDPLLLDEGVINIPSGETLLLFSDGLTDCRNPQGESFGIQRMYAALQHSAPQTAQQTCDALVNALRAFRNNTSQDDDVTLVTIHHKQPTAENR